MLQHNYGEFAALFTAFLWTFTALAFEDATRKVGTYAVNIFRLVFAFIFLGARSYAQDVAVIESEMVVTAKWVASNLPADALIAAHDIGALGYFDYHELIDLAGLVSPDVIPFIRNEPQLANYLNQQKMEMRRKIF